MKTKSSPVTVQRKQRRKRITIADVEQIAQLTECQRLNFQEATALLGIGYDTWRSWKERAANQPRYAHIVARVKAAYLKGRLANIADAETGKHGHRADWRASKALLEICDRTRYGTEQPQSPPIPQPIQVSVIASWLDTARKEIAAEQGQVVDVPVRLLPPAPAPEGPKARRAAAVEPPSKPASA